MDINNLITLFKLFKNKPSYLAKYLIDNNAFREDFLSNIANSKKLLEISKSEFELKNFKNINEMQHFYDSFIEINNNSEDMEELEKKLNEKLKSLILDENYEEAARIRDYMRRKNIKKY